MSVDHWTIRVCPVCGSEGKGMTACVHKDGDRHIAHWREKIEVVPAEQLRGAVRRAEVAECALRLACEDGFENSNVLWDSYMRQALDRLGGQSHPKPNTKGG